MQQQGGLPPPPPRHPANTLTRRPATRPASPLPPPLLERSDVSVPAPPPRHHTTREASPSLPFQERSTPPQLAPLGPPPVTISLAPPTPTSPLPPSPSLSAAPSTAHTKDEDDVDDEEDLEDLAYELAQNVRPKHAAATRRGIGAFSTPQDEDVKPEGKAEEDSETRKALDALEDEELQEFLGRIGRQVDRKSVV